MLQCRTQITSMLYHTRSRNFNYHQAINSMLLWHHRTPKRLVQTLSRLSFSTSYAFQCCAVKSLSTSCVSLAQVAAQDETKVKYLPYDNFNWVSNTWEPSAEHGNISHDEVSALLLVAHLPEGPEALTAAQYTDIRRFDETEGTRHKLPPSEALEAILPSSDDQAEFRKNTIIHIADILADEVKSFSKFKSVLGTFHDPHAIPPHKTEEYYLPTFDQEQGSTRGNMVVLGHYFLKVLQVSKAAFEKFVFFVLGDRLTTARDRAAQDQRAVDRSEHRVDHLLSIKLLPGLMHVCMNFIDNIAGNMWGENSKDAVSLDTLRDILPNRSALKPKKIDFYGWLRFMDAVLRALVMKGAMTVLHAPSFMALKKSEMDVVGFEVLCTAIADSLVLPSPDRLEEDGIKMLGGHTKSGHTVLLAHDLMTMREMRHAIKHGHPTRIKRMLKYWAPMFYAGQRYNYSNEIMEFLHNTEHDWPRESVSVAFNGMLVNTTGSVAGHTEGDLRCEQLNESIKDKAHGVNATPEYLEQITPAIGVIQHLVDHVYKDLGVEEINQHHAKVRQHLDSHLILDHFINTDIFDFPEDKPSDHAVVDLYRGGCQGLSGANGGHARHLARHVKRLRTRHGLAVSEVEVDRELTEARDRHETEFSLKEVDNIDGDAEIDNDIEGREFEDEEW